VYVRTNGFTPLFAVAGVKGGPWKAEKALRTARDTYPAHCFYCGKSKKVTDLTIDHVEPQKKRRNGDLANLVLACQPCNAEKADKPIEVFRPDAGREWLSGVLRQVQERLNRLD
jgi:5-methylcytosine-specific restriction endonuclease McrA